LLALIGSGCGRAHLQTTRLLPWLELRTWCKSGMSAQVPAGPGGLPSIGNYRICGDVEKVERIGKESKLLNETSQRPSLYSLLGGECVLATNESIVYCRGATPTKLPEACRSPRIGPSGITCADCEEYERGYCAKMRLVELDGRGHVLFDQSFAFGRLWDAEGYDLDAATGGLLLQSWTQAKVNAPLHHCEIGVLSRQGVTVVATEPTCEKVWLTSQVGRRYFRQPEALF